MGNISSIHQEDWAIVQQASSKKEDKEEKEGQEDTCWEIVHLGSSDVWHSMV